MPTATTPAPQSDPRRGAAVGLPPDVSANTRAIRPIDHGHLGRADHHAPRGLALPIHQCASAHDDQLRRHIVNTTAVIHCRVGRVSTAAPSPRRSYQPALLLRRCHGAKRKPLFCRMSAAVPGLRTSRRPSVGRVPPPGSRDTTGPSCRGRCHGSVSWTGHGQISFGTEIESAPG